MSSDKTSLGDRMKSYYEDRYRMYLPRRTHCIIRLDGKAFHTYTKQFKKPFDENLAGCLWTAAIGVMQNIQGSAFAYHQSDEVSILITDFNTVKTQAPFDYNIQKLASISASVMTAVFNAQIQYHGFAPNTIAFFDSRVFCIPERTEVYNYFLWRQRDCVRNSIMSLGQAHFSHKELHGLNKDAVQEKLWQEKGINWSKLDNWKKNGTIIYPDGLNNAWPHMFSQDVDNFMRMIPERED